MRRLALAACALAACTYPEKQFQGPFTCLGVPPPKNVPTLVKISGHIADPSNLAPLAGASVTLENTQMIPIFNPVTTDATGAFSFTMNTNGTPVDGLVLHGSASGRVDAYFYPTRPVTEDVEFQVALLSTNEAAALAQGAGVTFDASHGAVIPAIDDCNDKGLAGAVVSSTPAGTVRYFNGVEPSMTATETDAGGVALIAMLPPGQVTVTTTVQGMTLPARVFDVVANAFIETDIEP